MTETVVAVMVGVASTTIVSFVIWSFTKVRRLFASSEEVLALVHKILEIHVQPQEDSLFQIAQVLTPVLEGNETMSKMATYIEALYSLVLLLARSNKERVDPSKVDEINDGLLRL